MSGLDVENEKSAHRPRRALKVALALGIVLLIVASLTLVLRNSIRSVVPGRVYRSAQPSARMLERARDEYGVRSVINLRGSNERKSWYRTEIEASRRLGLLHLDLRFEVDEIPPRIETRRFVELLDSAPRPVLIHCEGGAHRSAWSAAVAAGLEGAPWDAMMRELTPLRGHVCTRSRCAGHLFFKAYRRWLDESGTVHDKERLRTWITEVYCPEPYDAEIELVEQPDSLMVHLNDDLRWSVRVTNRSRSVWTVGDDPARGMRLGVRIIGPFATAPEDALAMFRKPRGSARDLLRVAGATQPIPPGVSRIYPVTLRVPDTPGWYALQFDMVDEHVHWFSDQGRPGLIVLFEVLAK